MAGVELWTPYYTRGPDPALPVDRHGQPSPWSHATIHQFAGSKPLPGRVGGIEGNVDLNRFRGGEDALERWWNPGWRPTEPAPAGFDRAAILEFATQAAGAGDDAAANALNCAFGGLSTL